MKEDENINKMKTYLDMGKSRHIHSFYYSQFNGTRKKFFENFFIAYILNRQ